MTTIHFVLWLIIVALFLLLCLLPFLIVGVVVYLAVRYRIGLIQAFEKIFTSIVAWEQRIWYNASKINQEKNKNSLSSVN